MKWPLFKITATLLVAFSAATSPSIAADETPLSTFAKQLTDLIKSFESLDEAVANTKTRNERFLLAKDMLRLSSGFYALMLKKKEFTTVVRNMPPNSGLPYSYVTAVEQLQGAVGCFAQKFNAVAPRVGILSELDGGKVEENLRKGLELKVEGLAQVARDLQLPDQPGRDAKAAIVADGEKATDAANALYVATRNFAHVLDPSVQPLPASELCAVPATQ